MPSNETYVHNLFRLDPYYAEFAVARPVRPETFGQDYDAQIEAILEARPPVFSFVYGVPGKAILETCRRRNILTVGTATTVNEAAALDDAGVDCIIASGFEAGGHKGSFLKSPELSLTGTFALVPLIVDRVKAPVVAAGGIADGRGIKAALALGAQGVQIGTAFLACDESGASPAHRDMLFSDARSDTVLTKVFTGRLARSIRNRFTDGMHVHEAELPPYPVQAWFTAPLNAAAISQGRTDVISMWTGQAAGLVRFRNAGALFQELVREASA